MLGKTIPGHARPCVRAGHGCTCYFSSGENGTRTRARAQKRRRRIARRHAQRFWRADLNAVEYP